MTETIKNIMHSYKQLECKLKDIDEQGIVTFYYNAFGNVDSDNDISAMGSHIKSQAENKNRIKHFKNHDIRLAPGVIKELGEDQFGAWARSQMILGTTLGRDTYEEYKAGAITEHSFGYDVLRAHKGNDGARVITEYKIWEVSSLTGWGANDKTPVTDIKSEADALFLLEKLLKLQKGNFTDEKLKEVENKISELLNHIKSLRSTPDASTYSEPVISSDEINYLTTYLKLI